MGRLKEGGGSDVCLCSAIEGLLGAGSMVRETGRWGQARRATEKCSTDRDSTAPLHGWQLRHTDSSALDYKLALYFNLNAAVWKHPIARICLRCRATEDDSSEMQYRSLWETLLIIALKSCV